VFTRFKIKIKRFFFQCINELDTYRVFIRKYFFSIKAQVSPGLVGLQSDRGLSLGVHCIIVDPFQRDCPQ